MSTAESSTGNPPPSSPLKRLMSVLEVHTDASGQELVKAIRSWAYDAASGMPVVRETEAQSLTTFFKLLIQYIQSLQDREDKQSLGKSILEIIADAARGESWRSPLRDAGALEWAFQMLESERRMSLGLDEVQGGLNLRRQAWRLLANVCADDDRSRARAVEADRGRGEEGLLYQLGKDLSRREANDPACALVRDAALAAVYNLQIDFEPARQYLQEMGLQNTLTGTLETRMELVPKTGVLPDLFWDLFEQMMCDLPLERAPSDFLQLVIDYANIYGALPDREIWMPILAAQFEPFEVQRKWTEHGRIMSLLRFFRLLQEVESKDSPNEPRRSSDLNFREMGGLDRPHLDTAASQSCMQIVANVTSLPEFADGYRDNLSICTQDYLGAWLEWPADGTQDKDENLMICACMVIGNIATSDSVCLRMVEDLKLHQQVFYVLEHAEQDSTRFMATKLLRNLAIPEANKEVLGQRAFPLLALGLREAFNPATAHATLAAARVLVKPSNISRMLEDDAPETTLKVAPVNGSKTSTSFLAKTSALSRTTKSLEVQLETGRLVASILRCLSKPNEFGHIAQVKGDSLAEALNTELPTLADMLAPMVVQTQMPVIRSEGWFAMALLAQSRAGADMLQQTLCRDEVFKALRETLLKTDYARRAADGQVAHADGDDERPKAPSEDQMDKDKQNASIMLSRLQEHGVVLKYRGAELTLEEILHGSGL